MTIAEINAVIAAKYAEIDQIKKSIAPIEAAIKAEKAKIYAIKEAAFYAAGGKVVEIKSSCTCSKCESYQTHVEGKYFAAYTGDQVPDKVYSSKAGVNIYDAENKVVEKAAYGDTVEEAIDDYYDAFIEQ